MTETTVHERASEGGRGGAGGAGGAGGPAGPAASAPEAVERALARLTRAPGVRGAMIVDAEAGVAVTSELTSEVRETALAAMAGSLFDRTVDASRSSGFGAVRLLQLDAEGGHIVVAGAGPLLVVALTEQGAQLGLVRVEARRAAGELEA